jgi:hypothetical protein
LLLGLVALLLAFASPGAHAQKKPANSIDLIPTITSIDLVNGKLVASGFATAVIKGTTHTAPFTAPVDIRLAADQSKAPAGCPILDLELGPINLNLLGLVLKTSPICLKITAFEGGGLLGDLLCDVANLLNSGVPLLDIVNGPLGPGLLAGVTDLFNQALTLNTVPNAQGVTNLANNAVLTAIGPGKKRQECAILRLELGPVELNLLGLEVVLDNCMGGPVVVELTAQTGKGNLLGNLLCQLLDGGQIKLGSTLRQILDQILGLLSN